MRDSEAQLVVAGRSRIRPLDGRAAAAVHNAVLRTFHETSAVGLTRTPTPGTHTITRRGLVSKNGALCTVRARPLAAIDRSREA